MILSSNPPVVTHKYYCYDGNNHTYCLFRFSDETFLFIHDKQSFYLIEYDTIVSTFSKPTPKDGGKWGWMPWAKDAIDQALDNQLTPFWINPDYNFTDIHYEPKNNDGRDHCFWCKEETKQYIGFNYNTFYNVCPKCNK